MITPAQKPRPDTGHVRRGDNMALLTVDGRQEENFSNVAYRPDGQLNIPSQAAADEQKSLREAFLAFENAMLEDRNPSKGDPFPQSNFAYDDGTVPTLQEMAQYEENRLRQDAIDSGIPRADIGAAVASQENREEMLSNYGFRFGNKMFRNVGAIAKAALTGEGTAETALGSWDKYVGGAQAAYLIGGAADLSSSAILSALGLLGYGAGFVAEQVPFQSENDEDRLARDLLSFPEALDPMYAQFGALVPIARYGKTGFAQAPVRVGAQTSSQGGLVEAAGRGAETNLGPTGRPLSTIIPTGAGEAVRVEARPIAEIQNAASRYMKDRGINAGDGYDVTGYPELNKDRARLVAAAYQQMKDDPTNPAVRRAYEALIEEALGQLRALDKTGIELDFLAPNTPYPYGASPAMGYGDIVTNKRLVTFPTRDGYGTGTTANDFEVAKNPLLRNVGRVGTMDDATANDAFRVVHDAYGHFGPGNPFFRSKGEERAFLEHRRMFSDDALPAMASETTGQNSYLNFGPDEFFNATASGETTKYAPQKIGIMPDWATDPTGMPDGAELRRLQNIVDDWRRTGG